jgi:hypothetical protein
MFLGRKATGQSRLGRTEAAAMAFAHLRLYMTANPKVFILRLRCLTNRWSQQPPRSWVWRDSPFKPSVPSAVAQLLSLRLSRHPTMNTPKDLRTPGAIAIGVLFGCAVASAAQGKMEAGILVVIVGALFNAVIVTLVAKHFAILLSVVPVIACELSLLTIWYRFDSKYEGMDLAASLQHRFSMVLVMLQLVPALIASAITYAIKSKA